MRYILIIYRIVLVIGFLLFFIWLCYQNTVVNGRLSLSKDFCSEPTFISNIYPENRVGDVEQDEQGNCFQTIFVEPAYFKIKVPRTFSLARIKIIYSNTDQDIFQLGLMRERINPLDWIFKLKLIENKHFEDIDWLKLSNQGVTLWQKQKRFDSIYDYVNNLPKDQKTATFYYEFAEQAVKDKTKVIVWNSKTPLKYLDYIIAKYVSPYKIDNMWKHKTVEFLVGSEYMNDHYLEFMISSPGLTQNRNEIKIAGIDIELIRPPTTLSTFLLDLKDYFIHKFNKL